jgi:hypothetical protein
MEEKKLDELIDNFPEIISLNKIPKLISQTLKISTKTVQTFSKSEVKNNLLPITEIEISAYLQRWGNRNWELTFFHLLKLVIDITQLQKESDYLAVTLNRAMQITIQINNRIVLKSHSEGKDNSIGFIMPLMFDNEVKNYNNIHKVEYFTNNKKEKQSMLVRFLYSDLNPTCSN